MIQDAHARTAQDFLVKSEAYFAEGDALQGWKCGSHYAIREAVRCLADEYDEHIVPGFSVAE